MKKERKIKNKRSVYQLLLLLLCISATAVYGQKNKNCPNCYLRKKNFAGQDLRNVNFNGATLDSADFSNAILDGAMFVNASLIHANFSGAKLNIASASPVNFSGANLSYANFSKASMKGVDLQYANLTGTIFSGADLTGAKPGMYLKIFLTAEKGMPTFDGAKLPCAFRQFESYVEFGTAAFPACVDFVTPFPSEKTNMKVIERSADRTKPDKVLVSITSSIHKKDSTKIKETTALTPSDTVWVSATGTDGPTCGLPGSPCQTIQQAVINVNSGGVVAVDYGQYPITSSISITQNMSIVGGFYNGQLASGYQSQVTAPAGGLPVFNINTIGLNVALSNFILNGTVATTQNTASSVLIVQQSSTVVLKNVNVNAAQGGSGANGVQGTAGGNGGNGSNGSSGVGGAGGTSACGDNTGGTGGNQTTSASQNCSGFFECTSSSSSNTYPGGSGNPGTTGQWTAGSAPGNGLNYNCPDSDTPAQASAGTTGANAGCGSQGTPAVNISGTYPAGQSWTASVSGQGVSGGDGAGGGGGGCGGSSHFCNCVCGGTGDYYSGSAGGGGGAGGCGATGGTGGTQGGASFGIVLIASSCTLDNTVKITGASGGNGGYGGNGNSGGTAGTGGGPDGTTDTGGYGGNGGNGGLGGASGGGAGGNGGPAICIAFVGTCTLSGTPVYYTGTSGSPGAGGLGGTAVSGSPCTGAPGATGVSGTAANTVQF